MATILVIDDSETVRQAITEALGTSYETIQAQNGVAGLQALEADKVDLVLLDIMMPVMDGPTFLRLMRARGHTTPVVLLTSETKTSRIASAQALGIHDYVIKPVETQTLLKRIAGILAPQTTTTIPAQTAAPPERPVAKKAVLVLDDQETVAGRLFELIPAFVQVESRLDIASARFACRRRRFDAILVDTDLPGVDKLTLAAELRQTQPEATLVALFLRTVEKPQETAQTLGYDTFLLKPLDARGIDAFFAQEPTESSLLRVSNNVIGPRAMPASAMNENELCTSLVAAAKQAVDELADASYPFLIVNLEEALAQTPLVQLVAAVVERAGLLQLPIRLVVPKEPPPGLATLISLHSLAVFPSVSAAQDAG